MALQSQRPKGRYWEEVALPQIDGLTPGNYDNPSITVDSYGRVTSISGTATFSLMEIREDGSSMPNSPFSVLNFEGAGVDLQDQGGGVLTIDIPGSSAEIALQDDDILVTGGPFAVLNADFGIRATDSGGGVADLFVDNQNVYVYQRETIDTTSDQNIGDAFRAGSRVREVTISVTTAYDGGTTIEIVDGAGTTIMGTSFSDPTVSGKYVFEPDEDYLLPSGQEQVRALVSGSPSAGQADVEVRVVRSGA